MFKIARLLSLFRKRYVIKKSRLFDEIYYLKAYPDVRAADVDPIKHYILFGAKERRNPSPYFQTAFYLDKYPDVAQSGINPLLHYILFGAKEGRWPNPEFDSGYYLLANPDVKKTGLNPLLHYVLFGQHEGRKAKGNTEVRLLTIQNEPSVEELLAQRTTKFNYEPKISIIVPVWNTPKQFLTDVIESVLNQTYSNWELCIADGASKEAYVKDVLEEYIKKDNRIKVKYLSENKGIVGNSNEALSISTGDYVALLDHDDTLAPFALFEVVKAINENENADFIYSD
ncbi:MAG: glycosyltransferase, partial [Thermodesulfobium sp.]